MVFVVDSGDVKRIGKCVCGFTRAMNLLPLAGEAMNELWTMLQSEELRDSRLLVVVKACSLV